MEALGEVNAMLHGVLNLLEDPKQSPTDRELAETLGNMKHLTGIAEKEIHGVILSCVRARLVRRGNGTFFDHQHWAADMEPEVVIAVIAPGLAVSTRSIETLPDTLHVGATF